MSMPTEAILDCWFGDSLTRPETLPAQNQRWYGGGDAFDQELRDRFATALETAANEPDWDGADIEERLARVLLLDQVSRNIYRGTARAFVTDSLALRLSLAAIDRGEDVALHPVQRAFLAMPLQHAEDRTVQQQSVRYFESLPALASHRIELDCLLNNADYARQHAAIVQRFGRYPHRNAVLGRASTPEEIDYLKTGAPSFGQ